SRQSPPHPQRRCATSFGRLLHFGTTLLSKNQSAGRRHSGRSQVVKITRSGECKNSPKNAFVEDFVVDLLASGSVADRMEAGVLLPDIPDDLTEIEIFHAISHGRIG